MIFAWEGILDADHIWRYPMKKQKKKPKQSEAFEDAVFQSNPTDPQGSYTGCPVDRLEKPVQDADDL